MSEEQTAAEVEMDGLSLNPMELGEEELEPGMVAVSEPINQAPAVREVYRFREMEEMRRAKIARVIHRLGDFRKAVMLVGVEWYEEKLDQKTGIVRYYLCSPERRVEIIDQVSK